MQIPKNKGKLIASLFAAVLALAGCNDGKSVSVPSYSYGSDAAQSTGESEAEPSGSSTSEADSAPVVSTPEENSDIPDGSSQTIVYNHDPENYCEITFDGEKIIIGVKDGGVFQKVQQGSLKFNTSSSDDGNVSLLTLTPSNDIDGRYADFFIIDANGGRVSICIEHTDSGIFFPDVSRLTENNRNVAENAVTLSDAQTAQYITLDGSRGRIPQILSDIKALSDKICEGIDSDYEKLRAISYWVSDNIYYDQPAFSKGIPQECLSLEYMLNNKSSVCGGYSNMTSALCAAQGIRCVNIIGSGVVNGYFVQNLEGELHEWNVAEIDGRHILVDSGWGSTNKFYSDGTYNKGKIHFGYFDIGEEIFALRHKAKTAEYRDYWALV